MPKEKQPNPFDGFVPRKLQLLNSYGCSTAYLMQDAFAPLEEFSPYHVYAERVVAGHFLTPTSAGQPLHLAQAMLDHAFSLSNIMTVSTWRLARTRTPPIGPCHLSPTPPETSVDRGLQLANSGLLIIPALV